MTGKETYDKYYPQYLELSKEAQNEIDFIEGFRPTLKWYSDNELARREAKNFIFRIAKETGDVEEDPTFEDDLFPRKN